VVNDFSSSTIQLRQSGRDSTARKGRCAQGTTKKQKFPGTGAIKGGGENAKWRRLPHEALPSAAPSPMADRHRRPLSRQEGSHLRLGKGTARTTVPLRGVRDVTPGVLRRSSGKRESG
jgi:hypothetical protein